MKIRVSILALLLLGTGGTAGAQSGTPGMSPDSGSASAAEGAIDRAHLKALDADHDGRISRKEARGDAAVMRDWKMLDTNEDGVIDAAEMNSMKTHPMGPGGMPDTVPPAPR